MLKLHEEWISPLAPLLGIDPEPGKTGVDQLLYSILHNPELMPTLLVCQNVSNNQSSTINC